MKNKIDLFRALGASLAACLALLALGSCGGGSEGSGGAGSGPAPSPAGPPPAISGLALNSSTGAAAAGVSVTAGAQSTTTDAQGLFSFATAPAGNAVLLFSSNSFATQARNITVVSGATTSVSAQMVPVAATVTFDPAVVQTLMAGSTSQVTLQAGSLRTAGGALPTGQVTARLTPINPAQEAELLPGDYTLSGGGQFESFGAYDITFTDDTGNVLTLEPTLPATIRIPVATRASARPSPVPLMYFDTATGLWVQEGTATLGGVAPNQYYEGTVTHFTNWNVGQTYTVSTITACLRDASDQPVAGARVTTDGINYSGIGVATTDAQGVALVPMKQGAEATIDANSGTRVSNTFTITAAQSASNFTLPTCLVLAAPNSGMAIKLTWGAAPSDLDSHLLGPNNTHVDFTDLGSLTAQPFARLDVDDVTSFGPEVITVTRLAKGTYRYFVHNFSQTFSPGMTGSPARVELRFGLNTQIHAPPAGEGTNLYWHVFDFTVNADCSVTITPRNLWSAGEPANPSAGLTAEYCEGTAQSAPIPFGGTPSQPPPPGGPLPLPTP